MWALAVLTPIVAAASYILYNTAPAAVANVAIVPYAATLLLGPTLIYPSMRTADAPIASAVRASLWTPALWVAKECWAASKVFTPAETAYYALNPLALGLLVAAATQMALCELVLRLLRGPKIRLASGPLPILLVVACLAAGYVAAARGHGETFVFYAYIDLYRRLFGG
jgi:hypothetical protein